MFLTITMQYVTGEIHMNSDNFFLLNTGVVSALAFLVCFLEPMEFGNMAKPPLRVTIIFKP